MVQIHADPDRQILTFKFAGQVSAMDMQSKIEDLNRELEKVDSGFVMFTDLSELTFMENAATQQIATYMDRCTTKRVGRIVLFIPEPAKDVGFALLGVFHYDKDIPTVTCEDLDSARRALGE